MLLVQVGGLIQFATVDDKCYYKENSMKMHQRIWTKHNGPIPKDVNGRSMEIHHIDGDNTNNSIENLKCVTIDEHYNIHHSQGDWAECYFMTLRMNKTPEQISKESSEFQRKLVAEGKHHLLGGEIQGRASRSRVNEGTHNFLGSNNPNARRIQDGTHNLLKRVDGSSQSKDRVVKGTHNFLGDKNPNVERIKAGIHQWQGNTGNLARLAAGTHPSQKVWTCEHCGKTGKGSGNYKRHHGDVCKQNYNV